MNAVVRKWKRALTGEKLARFRRVRLEWQRKHQSVETNRVVIRAKARDRYRQDPIRDIARVHKRRRKLQEVGGGFTSEDVSRIWRLQRGRCAYCGSKLKSLYHVDHIQPIALGGSNDARNLQITCARCNSVKGAKDPIDYARKELGLLL